MGDRVTVTGKRNWSKATYDAVLKMAGLAAKQLQGDQIKRNVCGVDCHYGHDNCNYYCCGDATLPMIQEESSTDGL